MKSIKERSEKNAMQVTFVPASTGFDTQSFFLKQPVAEASINCDPLTLRVPVSGARHDRLLVLLMLIGMLLAGKPSLAAEPLGRFFFTPAQRAQLDAARAKKSRAVLSGEKSEETPLPETLTYGGALRRSDGKSTIWINNQAIHDRQAAGGVVIEQVRPNGTVTLQVPQTARNVELKVGQSVEIVSGTIEEPYARTVTVPKPETKPPDATRPAPGKPAGTPATTPAAAEKDVPKTQSALERLRSLRKEDDNGQDRR